MGPTESAGWLRLQTDGIKSLILQSEIIVLTVVISQKIVATLVVDDEPRGMSEVITPFLTVY